MRCRSRHRPPTLTGRSPKRTHGFRAESADAPDARGSLLSALLSAPRRAVELGAEVSAAGVHVASAALGATSAAAGQAAGTVIAVSARAPLDLGAATRRVAGMPGGLSSLLVPGRRRQHRRVAVDGTCAHIEVRGADGPLVGALLAAVTPALDELDGVGWWQVHLAAGRVVIETAGPAAPSLAQLVSLVEDAELRAGASSQGWWDRHREHPADLEPLLTAAMALAADIAGLTVAAAASHLRRGRLPATVAAGVALVDAQPRMRRLLETRLGPDRTDLLLTGATAAVQAVNRGGLTLLVDAMQPAEALAEVQSRRAAWRRWEALTNGPGAAPVVRAAQVPARPGPLPPGPVERVADQAAAGSLVGARLPCSRSDRRSRRPPRCSSAYRRPLGWPASPSPARWGLCWPPDVSSPLDRSAWRRLDRLDTVVLAGAVLQGQRPLVLAAQGRPPLGRTAAAGGPARTCSRAPLTGRLVPPGLRRCPRRVRPCGCCPARGLLGTAPGAATPGGIRHDR